MKYTGTLNKGITRRRFGLLADSDAYLAEDKRICGEMAAKLPELFKVHGVEPGNWFHLTLALAQKHVPGFKVISPAGRKTEWEQIDKAEFKLDVDTIVTDSGNTVPVIEAIKLALRLDAWASKTKPMTLAAVTKHYYDADLRMVKMVQDARAWSALPPEARAIHESIAPTN